ncbi:sensor histidine kinase [Haloferula sargassicola]|uniref:histidine kinase n=1 Tax=Haloferula sargassicola TaxID=490096 RepID=A0ABP9US84_9BACT
MRLALFTLLPMLTAAVLVTIAGERWARRATEHRFPIDRSRLLDFDESLRDELARLDALYLTYLRRNAEELLSGKELTDPGTGVRRITLFRTQGPDLSYDPQPHEVGPPEIAIEDGTSPFDPGNAVVLDRKWLREDLPAEGKWLPTPSSSYRVHLLKIRHQVLAASLVDTDEVRTTVATYLAGWASTPLTPLRESDERLIITAPGGEQLIALGPDHHGPSAAVIPIRTFIGTWEIRAWDGVTVRHHHDPASLAAALVVAVLLIGSGLWLFLAQRRALRLAAERVSFVNRVSHEFGTPLTNLSLNLDLARDALESDSGAARQRLGLVNEEIARLSRLVANVLTFSRRERQSLEVHPTRCIPDDVLRRVIDSFRPALARRGIELESKLDAAEPVMTDPDALEQIVGNLLSNVEKYAATGKHASLTSAWTADCLRILVCDRGPGIPPQLRQRVFEPFERIHTGTNEGSSGTGLGLTIARELAHRLGGGLKILETSAGTTFELRLPSRASLKVVPSSPHAA